MEEFINFQNVSFSYENNLVLNNISLSIKRGEVVAVLGKSGSGKSTFAKLLNALLLPSKGKVYVDGFDTSDKENLWEVRRLVGMVFQNPENQIIGNTVEEDIAFGPENLGVIPVNIKEKVTDCLTAVGMIDYKNHAPHLLSGGQKQKIALAAILAMQPYCIVFDEATSMLDPISKNEILQLLKKIQTERNLTYIYITHDMEELILADRVIIFDDGKVFADGTLEDVFRDIFKLKEIGLEAPMVVELFEQLRQEGILLEKTFFDEAKAAKYLAEFLD